MASERERLIVEPTPGAAPEIGPWLWAMEETRRGLLRTTARLDQAALDWRGGSASDNSIGALLYHIALVEMSWLFEDVLQEAVPDDIGSLFPEQHRGDDGRLTQVAGESLERHLDRLRLTRARFLERMTPMSVSDWHRLREPAGVDYACSPAWVVFHLVEHEAGHLFQIREIKRRWDERSPSREGHV